MSFSLPMIKSALGLPHLLTLSVILFALGLYGILNARNSFRFLLTAQFSLGAVVLALAGYSNFLGPGSYSGQVLAMLLTLVGMAWIVAHRFLEGGEA